MSKLNITPSLNKNKLDSSTKINNNINIINREVKDKDVYVQYNEESDQNEQSENEKNLENKLSDMEKTLLFQENKLQAYKLLLEEITKKEYFDRFGYYILKKETLETILSLLSNCETVKIQLDDYPISCLYPIVFRIDSILIEKGELIENFKYTQTEIVEEFKKFRVSLKQCVYDQDQKN